VAGEEITNSGSTLPVTGAAAWAEVVLGLVLLGGGAALVAIGQRRGLRTR
jgi:LPXTG-motif cell wall-anchored protein